MKQADLPYFHIYRKKSEGLLRRYAVLRLTCSCYGRFEDHVIFVCDIEKCILLLSERHQRLIQYIAIYEYTQGEAATMMAMSLRSVVRHYAEALDSMANILLKNKLIRRMGNQ
jgi:predicted DNA-binding protein (UPF0251 family)